MLTNRCEKKLVVLLINQKDYVHYNQQTSTNEIRFTRYADAIFEIRFTRYEMRYLRYDSRDTRYAPRSARTSAHKKTFLCKTNPISPDFAPKTRILPKNKPNSKPIQSQSNPIKPKTNPIKPNFKPPPRSASSFCFSLFPAPAIIRQCRNGQYRSFLTGLPNTLPKNASTPPACPQNSCSAAFCRCSVSIYIRNSTNPSARSTCTTCTFW